MRAADGLLLACLTAACLLPFLGKPLHIDDPVYVRVAQQILESPGDFFGFEMNWHGRPESVAAFNQNPPGVSFYLALAGATLGWSEMALHLAMLLPTLALILGTAALSRRWCASPRTAALTLLTLPAFLVSATTLMADVLMAALWCGAVLFWTDGIEMRSRRRLIGGQRRPFPGETYRGRKWRGRYPLENCRRVAVSGAEPDVRVLEKLVLIGLFRLPEGPPDQLAQFTRVPAAKRGGAGEPDQRLGIVAR